MIGTDIAIDLGTSNFKVYLDGKGIVLSEPSIIAVDTLTDEVIAIGTEAYKMLGRTSDRIVVSRPLCNGVISDFSLAEHLITYYLKRLGSSRVFMPRVVVSVPCGVTEVEKRAVVDAIGAAGVRKVCLIEEPVAAAIGAGVDIAAPHGTMIVDIGEGTTDMAVISLNGIAIANSTHIAGDDFNDAIVKYVRRKFNLVIGDRMAEGAKRAIGCAYPRKRLETFVLKGRNAMNGLPETTIMNSDEMIEALIEPAISIVRTVQATLEETPPELLADIFTDGIYLTGGSANLYGLSTLLSKKTKIPVVTFDNPENCVVLGAGRAIKYIDKMDGRSHGKMNPLVSYG
ncbi:MULTISPECIES: rod shape-determining protein [Eubacteriales]|jgi:rod shape-determining protein MreB|uniref:rod shape-determining protein n=1 Tax=Eubacteriales TaxID=186802 RepID=UPI00136A72B3|nr:MULTISPECIES: rod shape-determining protein [unclassified Neglectibacter]MCI8395384.1 rod shape-determining protein [Acutalibacter sp.]MCI8920353.1 rod shape-determining protein [Acutalibacter sp.]MCI9116230.1 rod shape-determining protein [Acutalibacter sp.]NBI17755.1 rod shape-determining protein [Neglectibacter sp. 59]NBJ73341.1 rod shape-determining protein [Neglectibacter sp. X4]